MLTAFPSGDHEDQSEGRDQRDEHVGDIPVQPAALQPLGGPNGCGQWSREWPVDQPFHDFHHVRGVAQLGDVDVPVQVVQPVAGLPFHCDELGLGRQHSGEHPASGIGEPEGGVLIPTLDAAGGRPPRGHPPDVEQPPSRQEKGANRDQDQQRGHHDP
jgi:hypothetical protein